VKNSPPRRPAAKAMLEAVAKIRSLNDSLEAEGQPGIALHIVSKVPRQSGTFWNLGFEPVADKTIKGCRSKRGADNKWVKRKHHLNTAFINKTMRDHVDIEMSILKVDLDGAEGFKFVDV